MARKYRGGICLSRRKVRTIARRYNYSEIACSRPELTFQHQHKRGCGGVESDWGRVTITVYQWSGKVATVMNHPTIPGRKTQVFKTISDMKMLEEVFSNPGQSTGTEYYRH